MRRDCILSKVRPKEKYFTFSVALAAIFLALSNTHSSAQQRDNSAAVAKWHGFLQQGEVNFAPLNFLPRQNPFYVALPYNDVDDHHTRPEAAQVIPWFRSSFVRDGQSVCKGRWVAIRHGNRVCYAQWEDVGPFATDHWQYVFGNERPRPNRNHDAGLDVSPAVRDYLGLGGLDVCDWKFVDFFLIPSGPWAKYGENNTFVKLRRHSVTSIASRRVTNNESISRRSSIGAVLPQ